MNAHTWLVHENRNKEDDPFASVLGTGRGTDGAAGKNSTAENIDAVGKTVAAALADLAVALSANALPGTSTDEADIFSSYAGRASDGLRFTHYEPIPVEPGPDDGPQRMVSASLREPRRRIVGWLAQAQDGSWELFLAADVEKWPVYDGVREPQT